MAYNPQYAVNQILNLKGDWEKEQEKAEKKKIADTAQKFYKILYDSGYAEMADILKGSNYQQAQGAAQGFQKTPDFRYNDGLDDFDINYADYMAFLKTSPYETDTGKGILSSWDELGQKSGYNELASGAGANGGNIDSYSRANAARQLQSFRNQGQMAAINAYNAQMGAWGAALGIRQDNNNQIHSNNQTALNNDTMRLATQADYTGQVPLAWSDSNNPYLNPDGTIKSQYLSKEFDAAGGFATMYNNPNLSEQDKYYISRARDIKTGLSQYQKYAGTIPVAGAQQTAQMQQFIADNNLNKYAIDSAERIASGQQAGETQRANIAANTANYAVDNSVTKPTLTYAQAKAAYDKGDRSPAVMNTLDYYGTDYSGTTASSSSANKMFSNQAAATNYVNYHFTTNGKVDKNKALDYIKNNNLTDQEEQWIMSAAKITQQDVDAYIKYQQYVKDLLSGKIYSTVPKPGNS